MNKNARSSIIPIRGWFLLTAVCAGGCLYRLASTGEKSLNAVFLGYSGSRLLMMGSQRMRAAFYWLIEESGLFEPSFPFLLFPDHQQRSGDEDGRIGPHQQTDEQDNREITQ